MTNSEKRSSYEAALAAASRGLYRAIDYAEQLGDVGAEEDLRAARAHIQVMMDESIRNKRHKRAQSTLPVDV